MRFTRFMLVVAIALAGLAMTASPASAATARVWIEDWQGYADHGAWYRIDLYCPGFNGNQVHHAWCWVCPQRNGRVQGWVDYNLPYFKSGCWAKAWPVSNPRDVVSRSFNTWYSALTIVWMEFLP